MSTENMHIISIKTSDGIPLILSYPFLMHSLASETINKLENSTFEYIVARIVNEEGVVNNDNNMLEDVSICDWDRVCCLYLTGAESRDWSLWNILCRITVMGTAGSFIRLLTHAAIPAYLKDTRPGIFGKPITNYRNNITAIIASRYEQRIKTRRIWIPLALVLGIVTCFPNVLSVRLPWLYAVLFGVPATAISFLSHR